jgi:hypothetical protein
MNYIGLLNVVAGVVLFFVSNWIQYTAHKMYADMRIKSGQSALLSCFRKSKIVYESIIVFLNVNF